MGFISADRNQTVFLGYSLDEFVEEKSKARFIVQIVESLDTKELYSRYSTQGGEALDPKTQLATWFLGYCEGITSSRKLEYNCKKNLDFIYISANLQPDHTSLSRFRKRHLDLIPTYFVEIIRKAYKLGISDFKEISIDGTKLPAVSSRKKSMRGDILSQRIKEVEKDISTYLTEADKEYPEIKELQKKKTKLEKAKEVLIKRKSEIRKESRENHQVNIEEPEATMHKLGSSKGSFPGYNAQVSTDTKRQLIVGAQVVQDRNDEKQFINQYQNVENNLGADNGRTYVADSGYNSHSTIEAINIKMIDAYIGNRRKTLSTEEKIKQGKKFTKEDYQYDSNNDCYICPAGKKLELVRQENGKYFSGKKYRSNNCDYCEIKENCLSKKNQSGLREIGRDNREEYVELMRHKIGTEAGKAIMFRRKTTVETAIGNIKSNMGYSRFRLKGLEAVNAEFMLMCIGHNLNKLFKIVGDLGFNPILFGLQIIYALRAKSKLISLSLNEIRNFQTRFLITC